MAGAQAETVVAPDKRKSVSTRVAQVVLTLIWAIGSQFLAAGTWNWTRGWICVSVWIVTMSLVTLFTQRYNPQLMKERAKWRRKDTKRFDQIFLTIYLPLVLIQPVVAGFDAVRYRWSTIPFAYVYPGIILLLLASALIAWVLCTNPYAETSVRIQTDRGQEVITTGPYRFVRHPMYVGVILLYFATPMIWGSLWALAVAGVIAVLMVSRTALEDRTLRRELPGYEEYAVHTRYRLLPHLW